MVLYSNGGLKIRLKKPIYGPKCLVFEWSAKSHDFTLKYRYSGVLYSDVFLQFQVGLCAGMMAGVIDIGATWLTDLKFGICPSAFYLNKEQCCWSSNETVIDISGNCSLW